MEKLRLSAKSAGKYVAAALIFIGYPENIKVETQVREDESLSFAATYQVFYKGKWQKVLMPLSDNNYYNLLNYGLELKGIYPLYMNNRIKENQIYYTIGYNLEHHTCMEKVKK